MVPACSSDVLDAKKPSWRQYLSKPEILTEEGGGLPRGTNRQRGMLLATGSLTVPTGAAVENGMLASEGHPDPSPKSSQVSPTAQPQREGAACTHPGSLPLPRSSQRCPSFHPEFASVKQPPQAGQSRRSPLAFQDLCPSHLRSARIESTAHHGPHGFRVL